MKNTFTRLQRQRLVTTGGVTPGASPGVLACGNYSTFSPANLLRIEINGATPGSGYDQLHVHGSVLLNAGVPQIAMNYSGAISNQYVIISNDGADPVSGSFTGLPEGATLTNNGAVFQITYHGGDGNDVVLIQKAAAFGSRITDTQRSPDGSVALKAVGISGATYSVEACTDLVSPITWSLLGTATADGNGLLQFTVNDSQFSRRFYRLKHP